MSYPAFRVAAAHVAPVFLDVARTVDKACAVIEEAARHGAQLVAFPEAYVPAFPVWCAVRAPTHNHEFFRALAANTMLVPGPELARVAAAARACGVFVSLGFNEGTTASVGCIWNANVLIAGAIRIRAGAHAFEAKAFNVVVAGFMDEAMRDAVAEGDLEVARILESSPRGVSMVLDPAGELVAGPVSDREELLYADIDLARCVEPKQYHDVVGSYNRFDIFKLTVNRAALRPITFEPPGEQPAGGAGGEPGGPDTPLPANG